jgi:hypothetical protein
MIANNSANADLFYIQKDIVSSTLTTGDVNIMETVGNGILVEEVIVRTDATGLAGGTNFQIKADGILSFVETVANLGATKAIDFKNASVLGKKVPVLTGTKYIAVSNTVGAGTGAGVISVIVGFRKLDSSSFARSL